MNIIHTQHYKTKNGELILGSFNEQVVLVDFLYRKNDVIKELKKEKLIRVRKGHLYLRPKGITVSNLVVSKLFF